MGWGTPRSAGKPRAQRLRAGLTSGAPTALQKANQTQYAALKGRRYMWRRKRPTAGLVGIGERVGEVVGMLAVGDLDVHFAVEAGELAGAGVGDDRDAELQGAAGHSAGVLQDEGTGAAVERAADAFDGDVASGAFDRCAGGEHLALAGGFEVAVDLLVDSHAAERGVVGFVVGGLRGHFYFKRSGGISGHDGAFLRGSGILRVGP